MQKVADLTCEHWQGQARFRTEVPAEQLVAALTVNPVGEPQIEDTVREALTERGHDVEDDSPMSRLVRQLTEYRPPLAYSAGGLELPSMEQWPGGTMMREAARWATYWPDCHHLSASSAWPFRGVTPLGPVGPGRSLR
ncbi:hypothetical protein LRS74_33165 [Streptomyces sp. LX-29]|uniref:hypothetical protein n=1 Tax=Streptomyces sp. LX-29 TaxID=2900152 RepID=UPI00240CF05D|nr:hypothetical protein [Streptomyces sp. LX-29]WFB11343.1 hypothetical protein LRS74_33165 [Streptomyces sp. LX-29]